MNYKAVEVIWIFLADGRTHTRTDRGVPRGPRGPKNTNTQPQSHRPLPLEAISPPLINLSPIAASEARRGARWRKITAIFY